MHIGHADDGRGGGGGFGGRVRETWNSFVRRLDAVTESKTLRGGKAWLQIIALTCFLFLSFFSLLRHTHREREKKFCPPGGQGEED